AGLLEVADVIVVHKADLPGAEQTAAQVRTSLGLGNSPAIPVVLVSSKEQRGIDALWQAVAAAQARHDSQPDTRLLRQLHDELTRRFHAAQAGASSAWGQIVADARRGDASAVVRALRHLAGS
ncbi:MAG: hypothetical protein NZO58_06110, partial [Gemmataceae bacterium]|nr:hypothetical protein [Gemmataceae bacterium]